MNKKDIIKTISDKFGIPHPKAREIVQCTFDSIIDILSEEQRLELRNFGVFQIKKREGRVARNPRTGEKVTVQAKNIVTFKPGKEMELRVRLTGAERALDDSCRTA